MHFLSQNIFVKAFWVVGSSVATRCRVYKGDICKVIMLVSSIYVELLGPKQTSTLFQSFGRSVVTAFLFQTWSNTLSSTTRMHS